MKLGASMEEPLARSSWRPSADEARQDARLVAPEAARAMCGGISESTMYRLIAAGGFPRPVALSRTKHGRAARVAFVYEELVRWNEERIKAGRAR